MNVSPSFSAQLFHDIYQHPLLFMKVSNLLICMKSLFSLALELSLNVFPTVHQLLHSGIVLYTMVIVK